MANCKENSAGHDLQVWTLLPRNLQIPTQWDPFTPCGCTVLGLGLGQHLQQLVLDLLVLQTLGLFPGLFLWGLWVPGYDPHTRMHDLSRGYFQHLQRPRRAHGAFLDTALSFLLCRMWESEHGCMDVCVSV